jgi:2-phosphosulfolactate phosphatase
MSVQKLWVHNLPEQAGQLSGGTTVVIDLLRASSTICQALASGASEVVPFREISEAMAAATADGVRRDDVVLGGERAGGKIPGFDLGNSPSEYTPDAVGGKRVLLTTTNGTQALWHGRSARRVVVGAFVNLSAVVASVKDETRVDFLCAGTDGRETREDILAAGAMVYRICSSAPKDQQLNPNAAWALGKWRRLLLAAYESRRSESEQLAMELRDTQGGRNLLGIGLDQDLVDCAQIDRLNVIPELDVGAWRIRLAH